MFAVPVIHPAFTFRRPTELGPLAAHVAGFVTRGVYGFPPMPLVYRDPPLPVLQRFLARCVKADKPIGVDVECAPPYGGKKELALLPGWARLRAFGVGADLRGRTSRGVEYVGVGLSWYYEPSWAIWRLFKEICMDRSLCKVFTNGWSFDIPLLKRYGVICK